MANKVIFLGGFVGFLLFGFFLFVCFQILDLLRFPKEALKRSDGFRVLLPRRVMERLMLIMVRPSVNAEVPADNIPEGDILGFDPVCLKQEFTVFVNLKRFACQDIRIQVMLQKGRCIFGLFIIKPDTLKPCFFFIPGAVFTQIDNVFVYGLPAEPVHRIAKAEGEKNLMLPDKRVRVAFQIIGPTKNVIDDHHEGALADGIASGLCAEDSVQSGMEADRGTDIPVLPASAETVAPNLIKHYFSSSFPILNRLSPSRSTIPRA